MKPFRIALLLACGGFAAAAQALTLSWSATGLTCYDTGNQHLSTVVYKGSISAIVGPESQAISGATLNQAFSLSRDGWEAGATTSTYGDVQDWGNAQQTVTKVGGGRTETHGAIAGKHAYAFSLDLGDVSVGDTFSVLFGDPYWFSGEGWNTSEPPKGYLQWSEFTLTEAMLAAAEANGGVLTVEVDGVNLKSGVYATGPVEAQVLPEPTALALLALGVAGLALRRKTNDR